MITISIRLSMGEWNALKAVADSIGYSVTPTSVVYQCIVDCIQKSDTYYVKGAE